MAAHLTSLARRSIDSMGSNRSMAARSQFGLSKDEFQEKYWNAQDLEQSIDIASQKESSKKRSQNVKVTVSRDSIKKEAIIVGG